MARHAPSPSFPREQYRSAEDPSRFYHRRPASPTGFGDPSRARATLDSSDGGQRRGAPPRPRHGTGLRQYGAASDRAIPGARLSAPVHRSLGRGVARLHAHARTPARSGWFLQSVVDEGDGSTLRVRRCRPRRLVRVDVPLDQPRQSRPAHGRRLQCARLPAGPGLRRAPRQPSAGLRRGQRLLLLQLGRFRPVPPPARTQPQTRVRGLRHPDGAARPDAFLAQIGYGLDGRLCAGIRPGRRAEDLCPVDHSRQERNHPVRTQNGARHGDGCHGQRCARGK